MAIITGTNSNDKLTGTAESDTINGLAGNDKIIGSYATGTDGFSVKDFIDGGLGNDTMDYSSSKVKISVGYFNEYDKSSYLGVGKYSDGTNNNGPFTFYGSDKLTNIETIIGPTNQNNTIVIDFDTKDAQAEIDLAKGLYKYSSPSVGSKTLNIKNFQDVINYGGALSQVKGNDLDNNIQIAGLNKSIIFGSKGNDTLSSFGTGTIDYSDLGRAVKFSPITGPTVGGTRGSGPSAPISIKIDKNGFGVDRISKTGDTKYIGATNKANSIDASTVSSLASVDVNLANNSLNVIAIDTVIPIDRRTTVFELVNFVDVIGSKYDDKIVGANKNGKLTGGGGNDSITGGSKNDIITGSDSTARGVGEIDTLTGGGGRDKFVLGDKNGAYYVGKGNNDYALITDFDLKQDSISIGSLKNYSFALEGNNTIDLYSGKDINARDLIAKIQIAGGISTVSSNAKSALSPDANLNAFVGKINIISN